MESLAKDPAPSGIVVLSICRPYYEISTRVLWASRGTGHWQRLQRYYANENLRWAKHAEVIPSLKKHAERVRVAASEILDRTDEHGRHFKNTPDMLQMLKEIEASDVTTGIKKTEDSFASFEYVVLWQIMCRSVHAHMSTIDVPTEVHLYWAAHAAATATLALARAIAVVMAADRNQLKQLVDEASSRVVQALTGVVNHS